MSILESLAKEYAKKWGITVEDMQIFLQIQKNNQLSFRPFKYGQSAKLGSKILGVKITPRQVRYLIKKWRAILKVGEKNLEKNPQLLKRV